MSDPSGGTRSHLSYDLRVKRSPVDKWTNTRLGELTIHSFNHHPPAIGLTPHLASYQASCSCFFTAVEKEFSTTTEKQLRGKALVRGYQKASNDISDARCMQALCLSKHSSHSKYLDKSWGVEPENEAMATHTHTYTHTHTCMCARTHFH